MNSGLRLTVAALSLAAVFLMAAPAQARTDCSSNANLAHVHRRLDGAIDQLGHDQSDYGGHKGQAMGDLQNARNELAAAEQWAVTHDRENPACTNAYGPTGGSDVNWGDRNQRGSNNNLWSVRRWVERMIGQLERDQHDYDGHRVRAIADMQAARSQLVAAESWAKGRGY